ncbi:MAG: TIGR04255 family protein [Gemmataceae bacterium]
MAFPEVPRVRYEISPLDEVIGQFKFPPILRIESGLPAVFQEQIRADFPLFETVEAEPPANLPPELARLILGGGGAGSAPVEHLFSTDDENRTWQLKLGRSKLSLSTFDYGQWEAFRRRFATPYAALIKEYQPAPFNQVCLRYRNVIRRSLLPFEPDIPWSELLQPPLCGFLAAPELRGEVVMARMTAATRLPDGTGWLDAEYGLVQEERDDEIAFVIDAHVFNTGPTEPTDAFDRLDALHRQAGFFFRWCITDRLHHALRPRAVSLALISGQ